MCLRINLFDHKPCLRESGRPGIGGGTEDDEIPFLRAQKTRLESAPGTKELVSLLTSKPMRFLVFLCVSPNWASWGLDEVQDPLPCLVEAHPLLPICGVPTPPGLLVCAGWPSYPRRLSPPPAPCLGRESEAPHPGPGAQRGLAEEAFGPSPCDAGFDSFPILAGVLLT